MELIPKETYEEYNKPSLEQFLEDFGNDSENAIAWYQDFLNQTDYIVVKIAEGVSAKEDYAEILKYRNIAREQIRELRKGFI